MNYALEWANLQKKTEKMLWRNQIGLIQQLENSRSAGKSLLRTASEIVKDDGLSGLWRGLKPSLVLTINPAITYGSFERLKVAILGSDGKMTAGKAFWIGALSKTLATIVTYPYIMAKIRT
ncbi:hypothetical protein BY996DRAFT_8559505 [Phakopsora pachyrhizi]|nr:hypothetical protein BY996DRAFT_6426790 [Phakopsora pachyrhizi]KAI8458670.1 hypothetical protein BY996DRAFT_8559505 [Phakopsora pachyrhizi]